MSFNHSNDGDSISNQHPNTETHQPRTDMYPVFSSLRLMNSKKKEFRVGFAFIQGIYFWDGRVAKPVATVEELNDVSKPGTMVGV